MAADASIYKSIPADVATYFAARSTQHKQEPVGIIVDVEDPDPTPRRYALPAGDRESEVKFCSDSGYRPPGQDRTRAEYHAWFNGGEELKGAVSEFENSWYIAAALLLTVGFGLIMLNPEGRHPGSHGDDIARLAFVGLALAGTVNAAMGVWWAGHGTPQHRVVGRPASAGAGACALPAPRRRGGAPAPPAAQSPFYLNEPNHYHPK